MTEHDLDESSDIDLSNEVVDRSTRETEPPSAPEAATDPLVAILSQGRAVAAPAAEQPEDDGLRAPDVHAHETKTPAWLHAMARQLHGWREHEHHAGAPPRISRDAYLDALRAANETDPKRQGKPSRNAVSPFRGKGI